MNIQRKPGPNVSFSRVNFMVCELCLNYRKEERKEERRRKREGRESKKNKKKKRKKKERGVDHRLARTPGFETPWLSLWAGSLWAPQSPSAKRGRHRCPPHGAVVTGQCVNAHQPSAWRLAGLAGSSWRCLGRTRPSPGAAAVPPGGGGFACPCHPECSASVEVAKHSMGIRPTC